MIRMGDTEQYARIHGIDKPLKVTAGCVSFGGDPVFTCGGNPELNRQE